MDNCYYNTIFVILISIKFKLPFIEIMPLSYNLNGNNYEKYVLHFGEKNASLLALPP